MKYALAAVGFINEDIEYNKAVLADTLRKCAGRADVVIFGEAFLQGFYGINFIAKHDTTVSISRDDMIIREICSMAKEYTIAVSFGFIEKDGDVFFSSQMTIDKNGQIIDLYRRVSHLLGREVAIGLCGDLWYEENITRLNELEPDIVWWPVYTDYNYLEWNNTVKFEYAKQAGKINAPVFYVNSVCMDKPDNREIAKGGAALFDKSFIKEELPAGNEGVLIVEV